MPSRSRSLLVGRAWGYLRVLLRRVAQPLARLEQRIRRYITATTPRRRLSRILGILLFGCMTIGFMGINECDSCETELDVSPQVNLHLRHIVIAAIPTNSNIMIPEGTVAARPRFTGTDGSQTGLASFLGNFTSIAQTPGSYFFLFRLQDCSLSEILGNSPLNATANLTAATTNYERVLHQLGGLTTTPDVYANGCVENTTGISSRVAVALGRKANSSVVFATAESNGNNNAVFILNTPTALTASSFTPITSLTAASALATADLNGDGNGDLVVVNDYNAASAYVSVVLGNGDGTFQTPVNYPIAGNTSVAAVIDDVNNDGKLDIVAVSDTQQISVLLGNGDGTFQAAQSFAAPALPGYTSNTSTPILGLITADVNGDSKKDIVCSNGAVLLGNGNGTFTAVATPAFPYTFASPGGFGPGMASGDINNDGKMDLVIDTGPTIATYLGNGNGTFTAGASYAAMNNSGYVTVSDLDGDGNLDIYTGLANGGIYSGDDISPATAYALMGHGDGTFVGAPQGPGAYNGTNMGDVNGDGVPDLITNGTPPNSSTAAFTVQLGNGKGGFTTASTITAPASFMLSGYTFTNANTVAASTYAVGDINGDGKADLVWVDNGLTAINPGSGLPITYPYPVYFTAISNGDGTFQPAVPHAFPQIAPAADFDISLTVSGLQIADLTGNGKNDLICGYNEIGGTAFGQPTIVPYNEGIAVLLNTGGGAFSATPVLTSTYSSNNAPTSTFVPMVVSASDLNGDRKADLIVNAPGTVITNFQLQTLLQVYVGNGDGTFQAPTTLSTANQYGLPVVADFNKDSKVDLAWLAETSASQAELVVALGNGNGTFGTPAVSNLTGGDAIRSAALAGADFNGDSDPDLALFDVNDYSGVFYGKGDGTFTSVPASGYVVPKDLINVDAGGTAVAVALTKDGRPDILAGSTVLLNLYGVAPVVPATTTLGLTASASTIGAGGSVKFTATVTPATGSTATPTGTVTFYNGLTSIGTGTVTAGVATLTTTALTTAGTDTISAVYSGDTNYSGSPSAGVSLTVAALTGTTTVVMASPSTTFNEGANITFTATVTPASGTIAPTGTVTFYVGSTSLGTATLAAGVASLSTTAVTTPGAQSITAVYGGDTNYSGSTSAPLSVTVNVPTLGTSTSLTASATAVTFGTSVTLTATVTGPPGTVPTGSVTFYDGSGTITLGTGTLNASGVATYTTSTLAVGSHPVTAKYAGATGFAASSSGGFSILVSAAGIATTTAVTANATTGAVGTGFIFTATVTPASGTTLPTGPVNILDGTTFIGAMENGAVFSTNALAVGTHSITAAYDGSSTFGASTSAPLVLTVTAAAAASTKTTLSTAVTSPANGSVAMLTAVVAPEIGSGIPTGTVTFTNNKTITLGTVALDGTGTAELNTTNLVTGQGADTIIATYNGSSNYNGSISNSAMLNYIAATPTLTLAPGTPSLTFAPGATTGNSTAITVTPSGGFTGSVALTAAITSSPTGAQDLPTLSFGATSPVNITGSSAGTGTLTVSTTAATTGALDEPARRGVRWVGGGGVSLACLLLCGIPRRRRGLRTLLGLVAFFAILTGGVVGCGGGSSSGGGGNNGSTGNPGTTAGNYTITVTATSGSVMAQTTVAITVN